MTTFYRGVCLKEIYWNNRTYREGAYITVDEYDVKMLRDAGVVADIVEHEIEKIEYAVKEEPENAMKPYKRRGRQAARAI